MLNYLTQGGPTVALLFFCSMLAVTVVVERWRKLRALTANHDRLLTEVGLQLEEHGPSAALELCRMRPGALARVFETALERHALPSRRIEAALGWALQEQQLAMERNLPVLGTLAVIAPFVGLLGTVVGIVHSFKGLAGGGPTAVSAGVAEALVATGAGLVVAIVAVVGFNLLKGWVRALLTDLRIYSERLVEMLLLHRRPR